MDELIEKIKNLIDERENMGDGFRADAYRNALAVIRDSVKSHKYIELGKTYKSKDYLIVTANESDGSQTFIIRER